VKLTTEAHALTIFLKTCADLGMSGEKMLEAMRAYLDSDSVEEAAFRVVESEATQ
jgi:hypothetical protein